MIQEAAELIRAGRLVAFPTETVYGLGANALDAAAVLWIFQAKGRPNTSPLIVHVDSIEMAREYAAEWPPAAQILAELAGVEAADYAALEARAIVGNQSARAVRAAPR